MPDTYSDRTLALTDVVETAQGEPGDVNPENLAVREETLQAVEVTLQARADTIDAKQATIQLKADTGQIKTDTAQIKTETGQIKTDAAQIKAETGQIKTETGQIKTDTQALVVAATAQAGIATAQAGLAQGAVASGRVSAATKPDLDALLGSFPAGAVGVARTGVDAGEYAKVSGAWSFTGPTTASLAPVMMPVSQRADPRPYLYPIHDANGRLIFGITQAGGIDAVLDQTAHERWHTATTRFDEFGSLLTNHYIAGTRAPLALATAFRQQIYVQQLPDDPVGLRWVYVLDPVICGWWNGQSNTGSAGTKAVSYARSPYTDVMFWAASGANASQANQTQGSSITDGALFNGLQSMREEELRGGASAGSVAAYATSYGQAQGGATITGTFNYSCYYGGTPLYAYEPKSGTTPDGDGNILVRYDADVGTSTTVAAPYAVSAGEGVRVGTTFGIAQAGAASGAPVTITTTGLYVLPKVSAQAWTNNQQIYWDATARLATSVATGNLAIGKAVLATASGVTSGKIAVNGGPCFTWDNELSIKPAVPKMLKRFGRTGTMPMQRFIWGEAARAGDDPMVLARYIDASSAHTQALFSAQFPGVPGALKRPQFLITQVAAAANLTSKFIGTEFLYDFYRRDYEALLGTGTRRALTLHTMAALYHIPIAKGDRVHWHWIGKELYGGIDAYYAKLAIEAPDVHHPAFDIASWEMDPSDPTTLILYPTNPSAYPSAGNAVAFPGAPPEIDRPDSPDAWLSRHWYADTTTCGFGVRNTTNNPVVTAVECVAAGATKPHRILVHFDVAPAGPSREWHYAETPWQQVAGALPGKMTVDAGVPAALAERTMEISSCRGLIRMKTGRRSAGRAQLGHLMGQTLIPEEDHLYLLAQHHTF